jgi:hypothetical protein
MSESESLSPSPFGSNEIIARGLVDNLPAIIEGLRDIYALRAKESSFKSALEARCAELQINSNNFGLLVNNLTELSKYETSDNETKTMYREMIKDLFNMFATRSRDSGSFSDYLNN